MDPETNPSKKKKRQRPEAPADDCQQPPAAIVQPWDNHAYYHHHRGSVHPPRNASYYAPPLPHPHGPWQQYPPVPLPYMNPYDPRGALMGFSNLSNPAMAYPHHRYNAHVYPYPVPPPLPSYYDIHPSPSNPENAKVHAANNKAQRTGKMARPFREIRSDSLGGAPGGGGVHVYSHRGPHPQIPPPHPPPPVYPPQELCVPSLASPQRRLNPTHIQNFSPWFRLKDLQQRLRVKQSKTPANQSPNPKEELYLQMNQQWEMLDQKLQRETVAIGMFFFFQSNCDPFFLLHGCSVLTHSVMLRAVLAGALDSEQLSVFVSSLKDRDPLNYSNVGIALRCLKYLTAVESHRSAIIDTTIHEELTRLIEWPVASRVLGCQNIENIFQILAVLLEDESLLTRAKLSTKLVSKLSKVAASIWITWSKHESIVQLARRILVAVNPNCDSHDEDEDEESSVEDAQVRGNTPRLLQPTATPRKRDKQHDNVVQKEDIENQANA